MARTRARIPRLATVKPGVSQRRRPTAAVNGPSARLVVALTSTAVHRGRRIPTLHPAVRTPLGEVRRRRAIRYGRVRADATTTSGRARSEEHTSELQSRRDL